MFPVHWIAEVLQPPNNYTRVIIRVKDFWYDLPFSHNALVTDDRQTGRTLRQTVKLNGRSNNAEIGSEIWPAREHMTG